MAVTMKKEDQDALAAAGAAWNSAKTQAEKDAAHAQAEAIRAKYNYSGGADGSQHIALNNTSTSGGQYVGVGKGDGYYRDQVAMNDADRAALDQWGAAWNSATTQAEKDAAHRAAEEIRAKYGYSGGADGSDYISTPVATQPGFSFSSAPSHSDPYSERIDAMLNDILNRDKFSYNAQDDELFKQYQDQYAREGKRAMQDTLGQVAARTGGMASSYAVAAAQQQNNYYMQQLSDKIPELYQLAYQMYLDDIDLQVQDLGLLQGASDTAYNRYRDTMSDWRDDRDFAYGQYRDDVTDGQWQSSFDRGVFESDRDYDYGVGRDKIEDGRYDEKWVYQQAQDKLAQSNWEKEYGLDSSKFNYQKEQDAKELAAKEKEKDEYDDYTDSELYNSILDLGIGSVSAEFVEELADYGGIVANKDGTLKWAEGWGPDNYEELLARLKAGFGPTAEAMMSAVDSYRNFAF